MYLSNNFDKSIRINMTYFNRLFRFKTNPVTLLNFPSFSIHILALGRANPTILVVSGGFLRPVKDVHGYLSKES